MNELIDSPMVDAMARETGFFPAAPMAGARGGQARVPFVAAPPTQVARRWQSDLSDRDLACLLQVIEGDLIPQLLNGFAPARHAPLGSGASSG